MDSDFISDAELSTTIASTTSKPVPRSGAKPVDVGPNKVIQPTPQILPARLTPSAILVSPRQKGNPILTHITSLPWEYTDTPADYVLGATTCALFLSLKYHRLHPEYIYTRIRALAGQFNLRILLTMVDIDNHEESIRELSKTSLVNNLTLILVWGAREAARYIEAYKSLERAAPTGIKGVVAKGYAEQMINFVTTPRAVNKTDAVTLVSAFGSLRQAVNSLPEEVAGLGGWGKKKVVQWTGSCREPFRARGAAGRVSRARLGGIRKIGMVKGVDSLAALPISGAGSERPSLQANVNSGSVMKPPWEHYDDEEDALLTAEMGKFQNGGEAANSEELDADNQKRGRAASPELSENIRAVLAKYRS